MKSVLKTLVKSYRHALGQCECMETFHVGGASNTRTSNTTGELEVSFRFCISARPKKLFIAWSMPDYKGRLPIIRDILVENRSQMIGRGFAYLPIEMFSDTSNAIPLAFDDVIAGQLFRVEFKDVEPLTRITIGIAAVVK